MYTEDFILRLIRQASIVLAAVMGKRSAGQYREAIEGIDRFLEEVVGLEAELIHRLDDEGLLRALSPQGHLDVDRLLIVADMLKEQAEILELQRIPAEALQQRLRALNFYLEAALTEGPQAVDGPFDQLEQVLLKVPTEAIAATTLFNLYVYDEASEQFARAVAHLEALIRQPGLAVEMETELSDYLHRLLELSPQKLEAGGLRREQVLERLTHLENRD